jgi:hypothetical protein
MNTPNENVTTNSYNDTNDNIYTNDEDRVDLTNVKVPVFRFKLSNNVFNNIREFSRIHQHDDRVTFKESWQTWTDDNKTLIENETQRLSDIGFGSNMNEKMFRTAKYYFVKKTFNSTNNNNTTVATVATDNNNTKKYITISHTFLNCISGQIEKNIGNDSFTPAKGYKHFIEHFNDNITQEIALIKEKTPDISNDDCNIKIKKTYKNKFYQYTNKYGIKQT